MFFINNITQIFCDNVTPIAENSLDISQDLIPQPLPFFSFQATLICFSFSKHPLLIKCYKKTFGLCDTWTVHSQQVSAWLLYILGFFPFFNTSEVWVNIFCYFFSTFLQGVGRCDCTAFVYFQPRGNFLTRSCPQSVGPSTLLKHIAVQKTTAVITTTSTCITPKGTILGPMFVFSSMNLWFILMSANVFSCSACAITDTEAPRSDSVDSSITPKVMAQDTHQCVLFNHSTREIIRCSLCIVPATLVCSCLQSIGKA